MTAQNQNNRLPNRAEILDILSSIVNPYAADSTQNIVEAGFITAPLSRMIDNTPQIGLMFDTKKDNGQQDAILSKKIKALLKEKTGVNDIQFMKPLDLSGRKHSLLNNMPANSFAKAGIKTTAQHDATSKNAGHKPFGDLGAVKSDNLEQVKHIILVASGKGGVGKSTVAANLAASLATDGHKVALLDADIYGPSLPTMFGIHQKPELNNNKQMEPLEKYGIKLMSIGFLADTNKAMIWRGPMIQGALMQMMNDVAWGELDYMVIDLPPGTGDIQLTLAQKFNIAGAIIVSTPQILALDDVRRGIQMFNTVHVPILGIIENMAYFESEDGVRNYVFGKGGAKMIAEKIKVDLLAEIPLIPVIGRQADMGEPIVQLAPDSSEASHYRQLARKISDKLKSAI